MMPYYLLNAGKVADSWSDLTDGDIQNPINVDENGDTVPSETRVWTGTRSDVTVGQGNQCNNWVAGGSNQYGSIGSTDSTDALWTYEGGTTARCNQEHRLYCFQQLDSDGDGLFDTDEVDVHGTDPFIADTDGDGLDDGDEVNTHNTYPLIVDSDGDGLSDGNEIANGTNPLQKEPTASPTSVSSSFFMLCLA